MLYTTRRYVSATITNTGRVAGAEIAQLYLSFPTVPGIDFPPFQLRGFKKVFLKPGESKTVTFKLREKDISYWNTARQMWESVMESKIKVRVAGSSRAKGIEGMIQEVAK
jgi:beta-glucosidase